MLLVYHFHTAYIFLLMCVIIYRNTIGFKNRFFRGKKIHNYQYIYDTA